MSSDYQISMPCSFHAGTTVKLRRVFTDYPASAGWSLKLYLAGVSVAYVTASVSGDYFLLTIASSVTTAIRPGNYQWREVVTKSGESYIADSGTVEVLPDIQQAGAGDLQTWEERTLAVVEAALENRLTAGMEAYSIAGRAVTKIPAMQLMQLRATLRQQVWVQKHPGQTRPDIRVAFTGTENES